MQSNAPNASDEFLRMAEQFFGGYKLIPDRFPIDFAKYFLFCHAIEVGLKAYLLKTGTTVHEVRDRYGHNLGRLLRDAKARGLATDARIDRAIGSLDEPHREFWARYPRQEWSSGIPAINQFEQDALRLLDLVSHAINGAPMIRSWL
jgi:hypothetical protein